jgi:WD40 repeat protein
LQVLNGHEGSISSARFGILNDLIFSGSSDQKLKIWSACTGVCLGVLEGHTGPIFFLSESPNALMLLSGGFDYNYIIWSKNKKQYNILCLSNHRHWVTDARFSLDNLTVFSCSRDNTLFIHDITKNVINRFFMRGARNCVFDSICKKLIVGFSDGRLEFFDIENFPLGPFITTAQRAIISEDLPAGPVTARPSCCGQLISIPTSTADRIEHWSLDGGDGGYTDPSLLLDCPSCATPLRMNPFFVDIRTNK